jgi:hypothetical protein
MRGEVSAKTTRIPSIRALRQSQLTRLGEKGAPETKSLVCREGLKYKGRDPESKMKILV